MVVSIKARSLPSCWTSVGGRLAGYIHGGGAAGPMASRRARSRPWKKDMVCPTAVLPKIPHSNSCKRVPNRSWQYDPAEADLEHCWDSCSAGFFRKLLYRGCVDWCVIWIFKNTSSYGWDALVPQAAHGKDNQYLFYLFLWWKWHNDPHPSRMIFFFFFDALSLEIPPNACNRDHCNRLCQGPALPWSAAATTDFTPSFRSWAASRASCAAVGEDGGGLFNADWRRRSCWQPGDCELCGGCCSGGMASSPVATGLWWCHDRQCVWLFIFVTAARTVVMYPPKSQKDTVLTRTRISAWHGCARSKSRYRWTV